MPIRAMVPRRALIDGELVEASSSFEVIAPADGTVISRVPACDAHDLDRAVAAARRAQPMWAADEPARQAALRQFAGLLKEYGDDMAELLALETGHPIAAAQEECAGAVQHVSWVADADVPQSELADASGAQTMAEHVPVGAAAAIVPWNAPLAMAAHKLAAAIRVGNTVVLKPSPYTPLATLRLAELAAEAFPPGVVAILPGGDSLGQAIASHPGIDLVSFTGSVPTGKAIMANAASTLKRLTLELGGNDPAIVLEDVDIDGAAPELFRAAFVLSGQVCQAVKRLYVHRSRYDELTEKVTQIAESVRVGGPFDEGVTMGPLTTLPQLNRVAELVDDAVAKGGVVRAGGYRVDRPGYFYAPTVVTDVDDSIRLVAEEQFGPALPVLPFDEIDEVVARGNNTEYGLGASVWTADPDRGAAIARRLVAGSVWINKHTGVDPGIPFGGMRRSGLGRESGMAGLLSFTELRTVTVAPTRL